jgi:hypothetical protein
MERSVGALKKSGLVDCQDTPPSFDRKSPPEAIANTVFGVALKRILLTAPPSGPMAVNVLTPAPTSTDAHDKTAARRANTLPSMVSLSPFSAASAGALRYVQPWTIARCAGNSLLPAESIHNRGIHAPQRRCVK